MKNEVDLLITLPNHPAVLLRSPPSLRRIYSKIAEFTNAPENSISLFYNYDSTWVKIKNNDKLDIYFP